MQIAPEVIELEQRAEAAGIAMGPVLADASVAPTTWWRWKNGVDPRMGTLRKVRHALDARLKAGAA